jgi:hypothetical protein
MTVAQVAGQVRCERCRAPYRPKLTAGTCPVCDAPAPAGSYTAWHVGISPDDRLMAIVAIATILNIVLLGLLAALAVHH